MTPPTPRLFLIRHGTQIIIDLFDIPLTVRGEEQIKSKAHILVGEGRPIDPQNLCVALVSPRQRAHRTFHLLFEHLPKVPDHIIDESVREWDYGKYEGLDGCPGGESAQEMCDRVDCVIAKVREYHRQYFEEGKGTRDVLIIAHGHFNRVLISRWIRFELALGTRFNVEPGGVSVLSYNHSSLDEPALNALNLYADLK
ncbi:histidine phosphatase superfamily [Suillus subluteus]|nr:histidine phosphatase superfamily [Suillus subluteus]